ncbi:MAG: sulfurtransferase [Rhodocyclaceae bacterium]|nr:sulfurtransferase [Rhodocyclaceae bacterium]
MSAQFTTLIGAGELAGAIDRPDWRVIDCRHDLVDTDHGRLAFADGHLPGACFMHLDDDLSAKPSGTNGRHPLPDPAELALRLGARGIDRSTQVVAYDDSGGIFAARLWWLMRWLGHRRVAVLDGGFRSWCAAGKLSTGQPTPAATHFEIAAVAGHVLTDDVVAGLSRGDIVLLDARSPDRFRGENETLDPVAGHVPGARNRFFHDNLGRDGHFKSPELLAAEFRQVIGGARPSQVVHMCGSGVTACHNLLAMEVAGIRGSKLYAGSWSEWCSAPERPVAVGSEPG